MKIVLSNLDSRWLSKAHGEVCLQLVKLIHSLSKHRHGPSHVLAWIPSFPGDVDLAELIGSMLKDSSVYLPKLSEEGEMSFVKIKTDWGVHLVPGPRGIVQPADAYGVPFSGVAKGEELFVLLPGLAFNQQGCRLGRGAGHYDRFLVKPELRGAIKIGVGWSMQVVQNIPHDHLDVRMDWVCHERGAVQAKREEERE